MHGKFFRLPTFKLPSPRLAWPDGQDGPVVRFVFSLSRRGCWFSHTSGQLASVVSSLLMFPTLFCNSSQLCVLALLNHSFDDDVTLSTLLHGEPATTAVRSRSHRSPVTSITRTPLLCCFLLSPMHCTTPVKQSGLSLITHFRRSVLYVHTLARRNVCLCRCSSFRCYSSAVVYSLLARLSKRVGAPAPL